jgi:outer membrane protein OmpA-like peptidoglycan-associated protein
MRLTILLLVLFHTVINGQNLVPNPSFENINDTINGFTNDNFHFNKKIKYWIAVNSASPDLLTPDFHEIYIEPSKPHSGVNMVGIGAILDGWDKKNFWGEYVGIKLKEDLIPKRTYYVEYWIRRAKCLSPKRNKNENMNPNFGILFYLDTLLSPDARMIHAEPQVKADPNLVVTNTEWLKISGYFTPESKYNKICLGQFCQTDDTPHIMKGYYQIDDVLIEELRDFGTFNKMTKLARGTIIPLNQVQFETGTTELSNKKSRTQLTELVAYLNTNPSIRVRVNGHTDFVGSKESNLKLSNDRAEFIAQYLVQNGIDTARIAWKGFGDESPIDNNETKQGRARNRRVEFEVID